MDVASIGTNRREQANRKATRARARSLLVHNADRRTVGTRQLAQALAVLLRPAALLRNPVLPRFLEELRARLRETLGHGLRGLLPLVDDFAAVRGGVVLQRARVEDEVRVRHEARREGLRARLHARRERHRRQAVLSRVVAGVLLHNVSAARVLALVRVVLKRGGASLVLAVELVGPEERGGTDQKLEREHVC